MKENKKQIYCPHCGNPISAEKVYCDVCGASLVRHSKGQWNLFQPLPFKSIQDQVEVAQTLQPVAKYIAIVTLILAVFIKGVFFWILCVIGMVAFVCDLLLRFLMKGKNYSVDNWQLRVGLGVSYIVIGIGFMIFASPENRVFIAEFAFLYYFWRVAVAFGLGGALSILGCQLLVTNSNGHTKTAIVPLPDDSRRSQEEYENDVYHFYND